MLRYTDKLEFDAYVAQYYINKIRDCKQRNIEFKLSLVQVKNILRAKYCQYTGINLTHTNAGCAVNTSIQRPTDCTLERLDNQKPYEKGNVCAVSFAANQAKSAFERSFGKNANTFINSMSKALVKRLK